MRLASRATTPAKVEIAIVNSVMLRLPRFLLYCLAVFIGVAGLLEGGAPLLKYTYERLAGNDIDTYAVLNSYDRFSSEVILILSLMLLIVVHIGHVLAGGLRLSKTGKPASLRAQSAGSPQPPPKEATGGRLPQSGQAPAAPGIYQTNEKLASLIKRPNDDHVA